MKVPKTWLLVLAISVLFGSALTLAKDGESSGRKFQVLVRLVRTDATRGTAPRSSKVIASPAVLALENEPFKIGAGQSLGIPGSSEKVFVGWRLEGKIKTDVNGEIQIDFELTVSDGGTRIDESHALRLHNRSMRLITTTPLEKTSSYPFTDPNSRVELTVGEVK